MPALVLGGGRVSDAGASLTSDPMTRPRFACACFSRFRRTPCPCPASTLVVEVPRPCVCRLAPVQRIAFKMSAKERCGGGCTWVRSWKRGREHGEGWNAIGNGTPFEEGLRKKAAHHLSVCRCRSGPGAPSISPLSWMHKIHGLSRAASQSADADQSPRLLHMPAYHTRPIPGPARIPSSCPLSLIHI